MTAQPLPVAVLISGRGGNLRALASAADELNIRIHAVISNRPCAGGIRHALDHALPVHIIDHREYDQPAAFERDLQRALQGASIELIIMAGFMRVLSSEFVRRFEGRMINLHPSLLPKYRGLNTHQRALEAGEQEHGASVHLVVPELDSGPVIAQYRMPVLPGDTAQTLAERLAPQEHRLLLAVTALFARRAIEVQSGRPLLNGQVLDRPLQLGNGLDWPLPSA